ncbi:hypothetical protein RB195_008955 [Necator americanus]|uniref:Endonuclease/exonuclease/phosphatase domain-containing protein n=1 Tax=Necator americanus TaxID=51031 RepID=A0ABR1CR41_NECAM
MTTDEAIKSQVAQNVFDSGPNRHIIDGPRLCTHSARTVPTDADLYALRGAAERIKFHVIALQETKSRKSDVRYMIVHSSLIESALSFLCPSAVQFADSHKTLRPHLQIQTLDGFFKVKLEKATEGVYNIGNSGEFRTFSILHLLWEAQPSTLVELHHGFSLRKCGSIKSVKPVKAPGPNFISANFLRPGGHPIHVTLAAHMTSYLQKERIADQWKTSRTVLIHRKGD